MQIHLFIAIAIFFFNFSLFHSIYNLLYVIPFILKWPYNIYSIRIYVLSIFGMVNRLSIFFLNSKISFFVVLFYFFSFFAISFIFPMAFWLFVSETLSVYVKVLAELEILESNAVCYYVWSLILLFHLHLWVYFDLMSILLLVFCFLSSLACESDVWKVIIVSQLCFAY